MSVLQIFDAKKEGDEDLKESIIGNIKFIMDFAAMDINIKPFWYKSITYFNSEYNGNIENDRLYEQI